MCDAVNCGHTGQQVKSHAHRVKHGERHYSKKDVVHDGPPCPCGCGRGRRIFSNGRIADYHSKECGHKHRGRIKKRSNCPNCGIETWVTRGRKGYCARCSKAVPGMANKGKKKAAIERRRLETHINGIRIGSYTKVSISDCQWCKQPFVVRGDIRKKYCSKECGIGAASQRKSNFDNPVQCVNCGVTYNKIYSPWVGPGSATCSQACQDENAAGLERAARRRHKAHYRAAKKNAGPHSVFDPFDVFRRDGWKCQSCGVDTPEELRGTYDDRSPELDHIVPVSKGGLHTMKNCQCLCRACNQAKSDQDMGHFMLSTRCVLEKAA